MLRFALSKIARALLVIVAVTVLTQWVLEFTPGSPAEVMLGEAATAESVDALNHELGFDRPFFTRYADWLGDAVSGDLGTSPLTNRTVIDQITQVLPVTVELIVLSMAMAVGMTLIVGVIAGAKAGGWFDRAANLVSSASLAIPVFVAGPMLLYLLAVRNQIFPVTGWSALSDGLFDNLRSAFLPSLVIALTEFGIFYRLLRADLASTMQENFFDAARSRGLPEGRLVISHALRPASISMITVAGISVGRLLGGTVVVETLFRLPGLGNLLTSSIATRDLITVQGIVVAIAIAYVVINTVVDLVYGILDPRIRLAT